MKRARTLKAVRNIARGTWVCFPIIDGKRTTRKLGLLNEITLQEANRRAEEMGRSLRLQVHRASPTVAMIVEPYRTERMSKLRHSTQRVMNLWINKYVLPIWGPTPMIELQPRPVQLWLESLPLAPKTRGHLRELLHHIVDYAMWSGTTPVGTNPISLVTVRGCSKRRKQPRSLKANEFHSLTGHLDEPFRTMVVVQVCLGLRVSELLALRWQDVDWIGSKVSIEHGIVNQHLDSVKTEASNRKMTLDPQILALLSRWRQATEFSQANDWLFPSPVKLGRLPYSYTGYWRALQTAAEKAGLGRIGTHTFRHTYRSWLDAVGAAITVQQRLMRHSDIQTTLNIYGEVVTDEMARATSKVASLALGDDSNVISTLLTN